MCTTWTPTPLLLDGPPFPYPDVAISTTSHSQAFNTGIDTRDGERCIVCGHDDSLEYCHIVPKVEGRRWNFLKSKGLIPLSPRTVVHEPRNGVLMCRNHHADFAEHRFFIRWEPSQRFVFINHSRSDSNKPYHGRAVRLFSSNGRIPYYGAFIDQEMRVRGRYPYIPDYADRPISIPPKWQRWITDAPDDGNGGVGESSGVSGDGGYDKEEDEWEEDEGDEGEYAGDLSATVVLTRSRRSDTQDGHDNSAENSFQVNAHRSVFRTPQLVQHRPTLNRAATHNRDQPKKKNLTSVVFKNPMTNPSELKGIMRFARQQPSWRAAVIEGESWDGTTEENIAKYLRVLPSPKSPDAP